MRTQRGQRFRGWTQHFKHMTGRADGHYSVNASGIGLTLLKQPKLTKLGTGAAGGARVFLFFSSWVAKSLLFQHHGERARLFEETNDVCPWRCERIHCAESNVEFKFDTTSLMPWMEQTWLAVSDAFRKSMTNHKASRFLLSHLCAPPKSLKGPASIVFLPAGTAAKTMTLRLASPAVGAHLHLRCSLCLQGDADADKDEAANLLPWIGWVREWSSRSGNRRSVFYARVH